MWKLVAKFPLGVDIVIRTDFETKKEALAYKKTLGPEFKKFEPVKESEIVNYNKAILVPLKDKEHSVSQENNKPVRTERPTVKWLVELAEKIKKLLEEKSNDG